MPVVTNISSDHRSRHGIPGCAHKIPVLPRLPFPQLLPQFWKFFKYSARRNTRQDPHNLGNCIPGRDLQKDLDMIFGYLQLIKLKPKALRTLTEQLLNPPANIFSVSPFAILGGPHWMIFRIVDRMAGPLNRRQAMLAQSGSAAAAGGTFSPRPKGGASTFVLVNRK